MATKSQLAAVLAITDVSAGREDYKKSFNSIQEAITKWNSGNTIIAQAQSDQAIPFGGVTAGKAIALFADNNFTLKKINGTTVSILGVRDLYIKGQITGITVDTGAAVGDTKFEFLQAE